MSDNVIINPEKCPYCSAMNKDTILLCYQQSANKDLVLCPVKECLYYDERSISNDAGFQDTTIMESQQNKLIPTCPFCVTRNKITEVFSKQVSSKEYIVACPDIKCLYFDKIISESEIPIPVEQRLDEEKFEKYLMEFGNDEYYTMCQEFKANLEPVLFSKHKYSTVDGKTDIQQSTKSLVDNKNVAVLQYGTQNKTNSEIKTTTSYELIEDFVSHIGITNTPCKKLIDTKSADDETVCHDVKPQLEQLEQLVKLETSPHLDLMSHSEREVTQRNNDLLQKQSVNHSPDKITVVADVHAPASGSTAWGRVRTRGGKRATFIRSNSSVSRQNEDAVDKITTDDIVEAIKQEGGKHGLRVAHEQRSSEPRQPADSIVKRLRSHDKNAKKKTLKEDVKEIHAPNVSILKRRVLPKRRGRAADLIVSSLMDLSLYRNENPEDVLINIKK